MDDQGTLEKKLSSSVSAVVDKHKETIVPILMGKSSDLTQAALRNDDTVRMVASYCYVLLPGLIKLAVKEPTFISFVMANREKVLGHLLSQSTEKPAA
ncbi:MAG: hypothetical protein ACLGI6_14865 [Gammaproteobacteria bacterium]